MRILHYALGFPPYRSGGLTKWCVDLMIQQAKEGHCVAMLWPGQMGMLNKKIAIKKQSLTSDELRYSLKYVTVFFGKSVLLQLHNHCIFLFKNYFSQ